ncbi:MAG: ABC transporter permease [Thermomicrobiales bacterium]
MNAVVTIAGRDARAGLRNRWFLLYSALFPVMSVGFSWVALAGSDVTGQAGFGRTSAGLLNLMLLMVPLIGLTVGAQSIVGDRQDRSLEYLLAQPVSAFDVYAGKYLGAAFSIVLLLVFGFGWSGVVMAARGSASSASDFILLVVLTTLLALGMLSVGFLISSISPQTAAALGIAVSLWLGFVVIGDLGIMGSALVMDFDPSVLLGLTLANPLDTYKLLSVDLLGASLDVLGPAGVYATDRFGGNLAAVLLGVEALWVLLPLPAGYWFFQRMDVR